ncbi:phospholipase D-like domain-containing protein [Streptomyces sp. DH12]|uniref:phospholipase D-like domain-containing protein n=1 Tax=Streptomyces sp. DH12 TaxID=2857010 RepID=UPI001E534E7A|nr:phospholipase D-like domain-containing protein [Streptomyces sp. DH12]
MVSIKNKLRSVVAALALGALVASPAAGAEPAPAATVTTGPVFNDPTGDSAAELRILRHLVQLVDGAEPQSTIRMSLYLHQSQWVTDRLVAAHQRGVTVQVVVDHDSASRALESLKSGLAAPGGAGSWVRACKDREACLAKDPGTTAADLRPQVDDYPHDVQAGRAKVYFFPRAHTDVVVNILKTVAPAGTAAPCAGNTPRSATSPGHGTSEGRTRIRIAQGHITRPEVAEQLWKLADAGCHVDIVYRKLDNWPLSQAVQTRVADWLTRPTAKGRIALHQLHNDGRGGTGSHTKYLLIEGTYNGGVDKKIVFTGSHTYTVTALRYNDETLLKYEDPAVFDAYLANFEAQRAAAGSEGL